MVIFQQRIIWKSFSKSTTCEITLTGERLDILIFMEPKINLLDHSFLHLDHNFL